MTIYVRNPAKQASLGSIEFSHLKEVAIGPQSSDATLPCRRRSLGATSPCLQCPRLVSVVPQRGQVFIRCRWTDSDPVEEIMNRCLVTVASTSSVAEAKQIVGDAGVSHVLVVEKSQLLGVIDASMLDRVDDDASVGELIDTCTWVIGNQASLGAAAELMLEKGIGCLPVVRQREVCGVITRGDLQRHGLTAAVLGTD